MRLNQVSHVLLTDTQNHSNLRADRKRGIWFASVNRYHGVVR